MRWWSLFLLLVALLGGCAYRRAIDNGNLFVEQQQYRAALAMYRRALTEDPDSEEAARLIAQITPYAIDEAEGDMEAELSQGHYESALEHVAYVAGLDSGSAVKDRARVEAAMHTHVEALLGAGKMHEAYPLAIRARRLFPKMAGLEGIFERLRGHFIAESERLSDEGKYEAALDALEVIARNEPRQSAGLEPRRAQIRGRWADAVAAQAEAAEGRDEIGAAAALYARAYEIAGRADEGDAMRRLVRKLRSDGAFVLATTYAGDSVHKARIASLAEPRMSGIVGVARAPADDEDGVTMVAHISAGTASCDESYATATASKDYVAGTKQVPNPVYESLTAQIGAAQTDVELLSAKAARQRQEVQAREEQAKTCATPAPNPDGTQSRGSQCDHAEEDAEAARTELANVEAQLDAAEAKLSSLSNQRASTPSTLTEDIIETFNYEVRHHTRACSVPVNVSLEPSWRGASSSQLQGSTVTSDDSHGAYPEYGIADDPLVFPLDDANLIEMADDDAAAGVAGLVADKVRDYYRAMTDRAMALDDQAAAADMLVAIVVAGHVHLDDARADAIGERLRAAYDLRSLSTLLK